MTAAPSLPHFPPAIATDRSLRPASTPLHQWARPSRAPWEVDAQQMDAALSPAPGTRLPSQPPSPWLGSWPRAKPKPLRERWGLLFYPHLTDKDTAARKPRDVPAVRRPEVKRTSLSLNTYKEPAQPPRVHLAQGRRQTGRPGCWLNSETDRTHPAYQTRAPV